MDEDKMDKRSGGPSNFQPLTLALFMASSASSKGRNIAIRGPLSHAFVKTHALAFLDSIQIALADAVLARARSLSIMVITIIFLAILAPNLETLNIYANSPSFLARSGGTLLALFIAPFLIATLAASATIVSTLTFRWIDRFAAAR
jgi:hypothetical protein